MICLESRAGPWGAASKRVTPASAAASKTRPSSQFNYGRSYLERSEQFALYDRELSLRAGLMPLLSGLSMPGCLRDSAPDAWGRRVILNKLFGATGSKLDAIEVHELHYLLESGSDRAGALDFQRSATVYEPRSPGHATLEELMSAADCVERGIPVEDGVGGSAVPRKFDRWCAAQGAD